MTRFILKLFSIFFLISCTENSENQRTEVITDSYFFQKNTFNMNLYKCNAPNQNFNSTYRKTSDLSNFYKFSELTEKDEEIDNCVHIYAKISELTPLKEQLLMGDVYMEISNCNSKVEEQILVDSLKPYLEYLKENNVQVWTGISSIEKDNFLWINIWESEEYRERFLLEWVNSNNSGKIAKTLMSSAFCENPSTYLFL
ncbi:MAG: hypothetical protein CMQ70_00275 [Gammaproteobacteria bacterium]|nr:hypothetical protein [Gammaproteobacteria bacterium]